MKKTIEQKYNYYYGKFCNIKGMQIYQGWGTITEFAFIFIGVRKINNKWKGLIHQPVTGRTWTIKLDQLVFEPDETNSL